MPVYYNASRVSKNAWNVLTQMGILFGFYITQMGDIGSKISPLWLKINQKGAQSVLHTFLRACLTAVSDTSRGIIALS